jgi:oligoendopeptidase F
VYRTLVEQANAGLPTLHRYLKLRKKMLGINDELAYYDNYPALFEPRKTESFNVETSKAITLNALAPMGDEYLGLLKKGFASSWMDSHPRTAKQSGAYMNGSAYDVHPYVLLNHNDDFESLSTFAHEWGHAVHSLLANEAQPFDKAGYSTFIAESASIINEMLLSDYMVADAKTRDDKLFYLATALESIRTTFFRQTMFAEFQLAMHEEVEKGLPLSGKRLSELYCGVAKRYYGEAQGVMKIDPAYCVEWAYISHFYYGYYVWQYATSMVGAAQFTEAIQKEGAPARDRFITLLKSGGADYPYSMYKTAGIDLAQPAPYQALMVRMNRLMDEFEKLAASQDKRR